MDSAPDGPFEMIFRSFGVTLDNMGVNSIARQPTFQHYLVLQGPPLNGELINSSHLLIVQNLPRPKWTLM